MGKYMDSAGLSHFMSLVKSAIGALAYAGSPSSGGNADRSNAILYGTVDSTSTSTAFTATVTGLDALKDGTCVMLHNGVVTSASGFTVNVNGLGAKPCYNNMTDATRDTTIFNVAYTMLFVYSSALDSGNGGWWIYRGYDANTNTVGYQLRTNSTVMKVSDTARYYKIYFTSADGSMWVPASVNSTNNATTARAVNQRPINPFGPIVYTSANTNYTAGSNLAATTTWQQYTLSLGYSFNRTGAALTLTTGAPVYIKCAPQADGSAIMDANAPYVQALPSTKDGKIYIFLGIAYSATAVEMRLEHPVYWHDGSGIRLWPGKAPVDASDIPTKTSDLTNDSGFITDAGVTSFNGNTGAVTYTAPVTSVNGSTGAVTVSVPSASSANPSMDGTASAGSSSNYARADHVHPTDASRAAATHSHAISDVANLQTTLNGKAASTHSHAISDVTDLQTNLNGKAPTSHASTATAYGAGNASNYGHVKLSDSTSSTSGASGGTAATPSAVKSAYDLANGASATAGQALSAATGAYLLKVTYTVSGGNVVASAHVYSAGSDVTDARAASEFAWSYRIGTGSWVSLGTGKTATVALSTMGLGGSVKCDFTPAS